MIVVACLSRTAGCAAYGQSVNVGFYLGESGAGPIRPLQPSISAPPVILQSTHEAALDVVDLADLKRRALELFMPAQTEAVDFFEFDNSYVRLRSEEHTSELQSRLHLVCRLLLE